MQNQARTHVQEGNTIFSRSHGNSLRHAPYIHHGVSSAASGIHRTPPAFHTINFPQKIGTGYRLPMTVLVDGLVPYPGFSSVTCGGACSQITFETYSACSGDQGHTKPQVPCHLAPSIVRVLATSAKTPMSTEARTRLWMVMVL